MNDVIVVGGGPAGSMTAMLLARSGLAVTLLERQRFPRAKPCGDCLSPAANHILARLGVLEDVLAARPARLQGWRLTAPNGTSFCAHFADIANDSRATQALAIRREIFDAVLLDAARRSGVRVLHQAHVTDLLFDAKDAVRGVRARAMDEPVELTAQLTIGADGLRSVVARRLHAHGRAPRLRKVSFTVHVPREAASALGEMRVARGACLGTAPVEHGNGERTHNITLVLQHGTFEPQRGARHIIETGLRRFGIVDDVGDQPILTSGPFDWPARHLAFDGAALVGDAAGYYDPFTGEGIYHALAGAELLAEHATRALHKQRVDRASLLPYAAAHRRLTRPSRNVQHLIEWVCARPQLANYAFARIARHAALASALVGVTGNLLPAASLFSPRMLMRLVS